MGGRVGNDPAVFLLLRLGAVSTSRSHDRTNRPMLGCKRYWIRSPMLEITPDDIQNLRDDDLRSLIGRLCEAELRHFNLPLSALTYGGNQDARDEGIDVSVNLPAGSFAGDFLPRANVGLQVKKPAMYPSDIVSEMAPKGVVRRSIRSLADRAGAYIIISSGTNASYSALNERRQAMAGTLSGVTNASDLQLDFYDQSRIAIWLRKYPGLIPWTRQKVGRSIQGWRSYDAWAISPSGLNDDYLIDDKLRIHGARRNGKGDTVTDGIRRLRATLARPRGIVRLVGLSGVGKTRLVQALFDPKVGEANLDQSQALYTDMGNHPDPHPVHMADDLISSNTRMIMIVDNCPSDLHRRLADTCRQPNASVSLLTIEYDIREDEPEGTDVFRLEPSSEQLIQKLITRRHRDISHINAEAISRFSGGNPPSH
jgi:hypothetical protein